MFTYGRTASVYNGCFCPVPFVNFICKHFYILDQFNILFIFENDTNNILGHNSEIMLSIELSM